MLHDTAITEQETQVIINSLDPLFAKAKADGLWFYASYNQLWFSPKELQEYQKKGSFVWGPDNWQLRSPMEHLESLKANRDAYDRQIETLMQRMEDAASL